MINELAELILSILKYGAILIIGWFLWASPTTIHHILEEYDVNPIIAQNITELKADIDGADDRDMESRDGANRDNPTVRPDRTTPDPNK